MLGLAWRVVYLFDTPPPSPRYGIPPYLIAKELREGLIPFPYLVHTVCIPPIPISTVARSKGFDSWEFMAFCVMWLVIFISTFISRAVSGAIH
jgi:hypothetical protein